MALVTFKDLCLDSNDVSAASGFWGRTLGLDTHEIDDDGDSRLTCADPHRTLWLNLVPEPKTVKQRVHLDVWATSLDPFAGLERVTREGEYRWTTLLDPDGGEFCVFVADEPRDYRLKCVEVDSADHAAISQWWADVWGGTLVHDEEEDYSSLDDIPGAPMESFDFAPVPEPKTVKNRIHWDVTLNEGVSVDDLVAAGATVLRPQDDEIGWTVMADPEGNEFCVFARR